MNKPILCLDFDGVIHSYTSGWKGADVITDPIVPGTIEFLIKASYEFNIHILSSRSHQLDGIEAMRNYIRHYYHEWLDSIQHADDYISDITKLIEFPTEKPPAQITIDDRAIQFTGTWPSIEELKTFQPWNKKKV